MKYKTLITAFLLTIISLPAFAQHFVAVGKPGKVFDEANNKYVTLNQKSQEVNVVPGMVFKYSEHTPGWYMVEYSPGLRAFIPESIVNSDLVAPQPGTYTVSNNSSQKIDISKDGNSWKGISNGKEYKGNEINNVVILVDDSNNPVFSLVDLGQGGIVINYDNLVTNFF